MFTQKENEILQYEKEAQISTVDIPHLLDPLLTLFLVYDTIAVVCVDIVASLQFHPWMTRPATGYWQVIPM